MLWNKIALGIVVHRNHDGHLVDVVNLVDGGDIGVIVNAEVQCYFAQEFAVCALVLQEIEIQLASADVLRPPVCGSLKARMQLALDVSFVLPQRQSSWRRSTAS